MICTVCREGLEGIWDPTKTKRVGLLRDFPDVLRMVYPDVEDEHEFEEEVLNKHELAEPEHYVFGHHVDYDSLLRSKEQGCVACSQFDYDRDDEDGVFKSVNYFSVFTIFLPRAGIPRPEITFFAGEEPLRCVPIEMVVHDDSDPLNGAIGPSTSDATTWAMIETWLEDCVKSHEHCADQPLGGFVPTRLLELSFSEDQGVFRLISGSKLEPGEHYATLSHCWGPGPAEEKLRLLEKTECMLRDGMPVGILPKTFRHAFEVIARLDIRYIWIDRLCIIQDSAEDWRKEAATMQTVYRNGFLNIAALGANDDQDGCFFDRDPLQIAPTVFSLRSADGRGPKEPYRLEEEDDHWKSTFDGEPLLSRAWVLQERALAARNLYFGRKQVFWECFQSNHCETCPKKTLVKSLGSSKHASLTPETDHELYAWKSLINARREGAQRGLLEQWSEAVHAYCECSLTFPNDKLVALSGLAKHMRSKLSDEYLAGLWRATMPASLLWTVKKPGRRPPTYRAPSWSWASLDGDIISAWRKSTKYVDVVKAHILPRGEDATGELVGGHIHLHGPLCIATGLRRSKNPNDYGQRIGSLHHPVTKTTIDADFTSKGIDFDTDDDQYDEVAVLIFRADHLVTVSTIDCKGLALVPVGGPKLMYRRVGYARIKIEEDEDDLNGLLHGCLFTTVEVV